MKLADHFCSNADTQTNVNRSCFCIRTDCKTSATTDG